MNIAGEVLESFINKKEINMEKRVLGKELEVSALSFGCMGMTHTFGAAADKKEMTKVLHGAVEQGYTYFDTAEVYTSDDGSDEHNEDLVGEALRPYRDKLVIATKFGIAFAGRGFHYDVRPEKIRSSLENSLRRLQTDYVDLYYLHRYSPVDSIEEIAGVMDRLIKEGKIKHWGLSAVGEDVIRRAHSVCPVTAVQNTYSMVARVEEKLFPMYEELNIGLVAYTPLAKWFLSMAYDADTVFPEGDWRGWMGIFKPEGMDKNKVIVNMLRETASEKNATPAQIALAWMMCKKPWIVPIPGTRKMERMIENAGAVNVKLSADEIKKIDTVLKTLPEDGNPLGR